MAPQRSAKQPIVVVEFAEEHDRHARSLENRRHRIRSATASFRGADAPVHPELQHELEEMEQRPPSPLLSAVWAQLGLPGEPLVDGLLPSQRKSSPEPELSEEELRAAYVYERLKLAGVRDPSSPDFRSRVSHAAREFELDADRYQEAAAALVGQGNGKRLQLGELDAVTRQLTDEEVQAGDQTALAERIEAVRARHTRGKPAQAFTFEPVTLDCAARLDTGRLRAAGVIHYHAQLRDAHVFETIDRIVEDAGLGEIELPWGAAELVEGYRRRRDHRWRSQESVQALAGRIFGPPFPSLWRTFVCSVQKLVARQTRDDLLGAGIPTRISQEPARAAALAVAMHVDEHVGSPFAAEQLRRQMLRARAILHNPSVQRAYCAEDWLDVVRATCDRVEISDITDQITRAEGGATVFAWLAKKASSLCDPCNGPLLDEELVAGGECASDPLTDPADADFAAACVRLCQLMDGPRYEDETPEVRGEERPPGAPPAAEIPPPAALQLKPQMFARAAAGSRV